MLDEGGDIWRIKIEKPAQASGPIGDHSMIIPFRQTKFKAALLKWIILNNIKYKKIASGHLKAVAITNALTILALPDSSTTIASWIHDMY